MVRENQALSAHQEHEDHGAIFVMRADQLSEEERRAAANGCARGAGQQSRHVGRTTVEAPTTGGSFCCTESLVRSRSRFATACRYPRSNSSTVSVGLARTDANT